MVADPNDRCQFQLGIIKEHDNHYICTKHVSLNWIQMILVQRSPQLVKEHQNTRSSRSFEAPRSSFWPNIHNPLSFSNPTNLAIQINSNFKVQLLTTLMKVCRNSWRIGNSSLYIYLKVPDKCKICQDPLQNEKLKFSSLHFCLID